MRGLCLFVVVALAGCGEPAPPMSAAKKASRQEKAESALSVNPVPRSYRFDGNELKVIEVPVKDGSGFVDTQRCFVWRDQEFKTASISCESRPEIVVSDTN